MLRRLEVARACALVFVSTLFAWGGPPPEAAAKGKLDKLLTEASEAAGDGDFDAAAARYGAALAFAQKKGDLAAEGRTAEELDLLFEGRAIASIQGVETAGGLAPKSRHRDLLALVLGQLDPVRSGGFVSGPVLARRLLLEATAAGDGDHVGLATDVLRAHAKKGKKTGKAAAVFADYAAGMLAVEAEKPGDATKPLEKALAVAVEQQWTEVALHVGTELAAAWRAVGDDDRAAKALKDAGRVITADTGASTVALWKRLVEKRLVDAPATVLAGYVEATARAGKRGPIVARPAGFDGPLGTGFGERKSTDLGRAFGRFSKTKPLVTAQRERAGFRLETWFEPKSHAVVAYSDDLQRREKGGLTVGFLGKGVALGRVVLENEASQGIQRIQVRDGRAAFRATPVRALYLVAEGETWGVTKQGVVSITASKK